MFSLSFTFRTKPKDRSVCPWDPQQMASLTRRLGIKPNELNDAIIETGSLDLHYIKAYIKRKKHQLIFVKKLTDTTTI
jgi:hypothetical protein